MHVAVIGGGIAGLATAYFLQEHAAEQALPLELTLIERGRAAGGKIVSAQESGFLIEGGPDSFITTKPAALQLCRRLGLEGELIGSNASLRRVYIWSRGRLESLPEGMVMMLPGKIMSFLRSSLISWPGKLRMGLDLLLPARRGGGDESLAHFVRRRLGREALERLAEPLIAGIYVAEAERLSLSSTFPRFVELERAHGSLIRGMLKQQRAARARPAQPTFMTLRGGLQRLTERLLEQLEPSCRCLIGQRVAGIAGSSRGYAITLEDGAVLKADVVVCATPAYATAEIVEQLAPALATVLRGIRYVSTATVSLGFRRGDIQHALDGSGFVVPRVERRKILACTWSSCKFSGRAPDDYALLRVFIGGARAQQQLALDDAALVDLALAELREIMGPLGTPVISKVFRWPLASPQYEPGHAEQIGALERLCAEYPGLYLVGSAYRGVGIPDCIQDAARAAAAILGLKEGNDAATISAGTPAHA